MEGVLRDSCERGLELRLADLIHAVMINHCYMHIGVHMMQETARNGPARAARRVVAVVSGDMMDTVLCWLRLKGGMHIVGQQT